MSAALGDKNLDNYHALVNKVDELCAAVNSTFAEHIYCRAGCSGCCQELTLFPVEAAVVLAALSGLSPEAAAKIALSGEDINNDRCPMLADGLCLVYTNRPIICRTHGLPLLLSSAGERKIDFCPENFREVQSLPGQAIINLDLLNHALVAINALFVENTAVAQLKNKPRLSISAIIKIWKGLPDEPA